MPPKLQVDESFAFLFTCIEASGCKVDFKLVGDATDLQPAAARMRYTRLRKAVEAGHFKGATLVQPNLITASLSQLANPHSRRIGNSQPLDEEHQDRHSSTHGHSPTRSLRTRPNRTINIDEEEEEEEEDDDEEVIEGLEHLRRRRRRGSDSNKALPRDNDLFFPDNSRSSRAHKRIKRSDSDLEDEKYPEHARMRLDHGLQRTGQRPPDDRTSSQSEAYRPAAQPWESPHNAHEGRQQGMPVSASVANYQFQQNYNDPHQYAHVSRKKRSANAAAQAAYNVGVGLGKWAPHPGGASVQDQTSSHVSAPNYAQRLAYTDAGISSTPINSPWHDANGVYGQHSQLDRSMYPHQAYEQVTYLHGPYAGLPTSSAALQTVPTSATVNSPYQGHIHSQTDPDANSATRHQSTTVAHQYNPSEPNRFHPASVFDGFNAPTMLSYTPSSRTGSGVQQNGEMSLLHKVMMEREKDKNHLEKQTHRHGEAVNKKAAVTDSTGSAKKRTTTTDPQEHEIEAVHDVHTDGGVDNSAGNHNQRAQYPTRHRATGTGTVRANPGDTIEKK